jgi:hypothetical protein
MAANEKKDGESIKQDPFVDKLRPDPSAAPSAVMPIEGVPGSSSRDGWLRLYLNRSLTYYAEFRRADVVFTEPVALEQSTIAGLNTTRVGVLHDAVIEYTRTTRAKAQDEFDLDIQLAAPSGVGASQPQIPTRTCPDNTFCGTCNGTCDATCGRTCTCRTCQTCQTCPAQTCNTCHTQCGTCQTCAGQQTCNTCNTQCGTCDTCAGQQTCQRTCTCHRTCQDNCTDTCHRPCQ